MPSLPEIMLSSVVMVVGADLQASVGLGMALLVVPILAMVNTGFVPGPVMFAGIVLAAATAFRDRAAVDRVTLRASLLGLAAGTAVGVAALAYISGPLLPKVFGSLILLAVAISIARPNIVATPLSLLMGSTAAGIMGAMVGIHGPAIALVMQHAKPMQTRATLGAFFAIGYVIAVALRAVAGLFGTQELILGLALLPGTIIGYLAAPLISRFIDEATMRVAILVISSASALSLCSDEYVSPIISARWSARAPKVPGTRARRGLVISSRLIVQGDLGDASLHERAARRPVSDFETVEPDAAHRGNLIRQHIAYST